MILGIDIGTQLFGLTILSEDGSILINELIDLRKTNFDTHFKKAQEVKEKLLKIKNSYDIKNIFIEQSLSAFRPGLSSANVLLTIAKFNGIVSWIAYEIFGKEPEYIGASTARKALGIKVERGQNAKEIVLKHVIDNEPSFVVEYTPKGNAKAGTFDRADSYVIAKAGYIQCLKAKK